VYFHPTAINIYRVMGLDVVRNGDFDKVEGGHPCPMDIVLVY